jgi:hypothetical protein
MWKAPYGTDLPASADVEALAAAFSAADMEDPTAEWAGSE